MAPLCKTVILLGTKLTFLARSHLAPKFSKVVAKAKKLGAINKKIVEKTHYAVMSNGSFPSFEVSAQPKGTFHFTIYNVTCGKSKMADADMFGS